MLLSNIYREIVKNLLFFSFEHEFTQDRYKRFSELCIFFNYTEKKAKIENHTDYQTLKEYLITETNKISADDVFKNLYTAYHVILPYTFIRKYKKFEHLEKCLDIICDNRFMSSEIPPHRAMEWDYMLYNLGRKTQVIIPKSSILKKTCHLQYIDRDIAYAITHSLFYVTDFGFSLDRPPIKNLKKLKFQLECLIARFYEENDVDLVLELGINYFSLAPHVDINYDILEIIDYCLTKTFFIEFNCNEDTLKKKYHTLFVLGIFYSLLNSLTSNPNTEKNKDKLVNILSKTVFGNTETHKNLYSDNYINFKPEIKAWHIIKKLNSKESNKTYYQEYIANFSNNPYLAKEIISYLKILKKRNNANILWNKEFIHLDVSIDEQKKLKSEYKNKIQSDINYYQTCIKQGK